MKVHKGISDRDSFAQDDNASWRVMQADCRFKGLPHFVRDVNQEIQNQRFKNKRCKTKRCRTVDANNSRKMIPS
jgi:hypothetical protein